MKEPIGREVKTESCKKVMHMTLKKYAQKEGQDQYGKKASNRCPTEGRT
jgi:hypothetical protein